MARMTSLKIQALALVLIGMLATAGPILADKPSGKDHAEKGKKTEKHESGEAKGKKGKGGHGRDHDSVEVPKHFDDRHRAIIRDYLSTQFHSGNCPPGLAKKDNGCLPPGQAKKWMKGQTLPPDVVYYELPPEIVTLFGPPPAGHHYVRVANDVLLIAIGTGMILDAIIGP